MDRFDLGTHTREITTSSGKAQYWFTYGLNWCYGFNQEEGVTCFQKALEYDPECAMAHWGIAYAAGPFYNYAWCDFSEDEAERCCKLCYQHVERAKFYAKTTTPVEQDLIQALAYRFQKPHRVTQDEFNRWDDDYSNAMRTVYTRHPNDHDVAALFAEAMMTRTPWKLWDVHTGKPPAATDTYEIIDVLERSIASLEEQGSAPHPALLHLHIHALEMSNHPEQAMQSADSLQDLCPDAGHLNHMSGHIYVLCGLYEKARAASVKAIRADDMYLEYAGPHNFYTTARCHDLHLMMYTCMLSGKFKPALHAAERIEKTLSKEVLSVTGRPQLATTMEGYHAMKMHVLVRFGKWRQIIETDLPDDQELYCVSIAMHHYARGIAYATLKNPEAAAVEQQHFHDSLTRIPPPRKFFNNSALSTLGVGEKMLAGEMAYHLGNYHEAFDHLRESVRRDDQLEYSEPWAWMHPPRHALAALLAEQSHYQEAEEVYRTDLGLNNQLQRCARHPDNVWSLHGLVECLKMRGEKIERPLLEKKLKLALAQADCEITSSCMCRHNVADV
ncbi:hypothetical protein AB833_07480 [Chromatiales bacterium (ex Bugula neritina AB1)]|nr:hypothetical protein AB833_07480 [Chromatiales bacterium (ex Bugula neritina AB1)]